MRPPVVGSSSIAVDSALNAPEGPFTLCNPSQYFIKSANCLQQPATANQHHHLLPFSITKACRLSHLLLPILLPCLSCIHQRAVELHTSYDRLPMTLLIGRRSFRGMFKHVTPDIDQLFQLGHGPESGPGPGPGPTRQLVSSIFQRLWQLANICTSYR